MTNLTEAIAAARRFRANFEDGEDIDPRCGFTVEHLDRLIEWAGTCSEAVPPQG
jgi:hypothetical protein